MEETAVMDGREKKCRPAPAGANTDDAKLKPSAEEESLFCSDVPFLGTSEPNAACTSAEDELRILVDRARRGDRAVLAQLRTALDDNPELWRHAANLAAHAENAWIELIAGPDIYIEESLHRRLEELKKELAGAESPTPLERLLIDRIAVCSLMAYFADLSYVQNKDCSTTLAKFALDRQDRAQRRLLTSISALRTASRVCTQREPGRTRRNQGGRSVDSHSVTANGETVGEDAARSNPGGGSGNARSKRRRVGIYRESEPDGEPSDGVRPVPGDVTKTRTRSVGVAIKQQAR
jgi:hypothetical protein